MELTEISVPKGKLRELSVSLTQYFELVVDPDCSICVIANFRFVLGELVRVTAHDSRHMPLHDYNCNRYITKIHTPLLYLGIKNVLVYTLSMVNSAQA